MPPKMRQSHIMRALKQSHSGLLTAEGGDVAPKLLRSMRFHASAHIRLCKHLQDMHDGGTLVVEWDQGIPISITLPELVTSSVADESENPEVPAPKGLKATRPLRTSAGQSSPVQVDYTSPEAEEVAKAAAEEVATAGQMVLEELHKRTQDTMTHQELAQSTLALLNGVVSAVALQSLTQPVVTWLVNNGHLVKLPGETVTYRLVRKDPNKLILRLLEDMEEAHEIEAALRREITELKRAAESQISPEKLSELLDGLERGAETERRLNEEIRSLKLERIRCTEAHERELKTLRTQLEAAASTNGELQRQLNNRPAGIDEATKERARRLGYDI